MALFLASVGFGLVTASVLAIAAVGFTLQFGVTDVLNLAYGAIMIAGAFIAYAVNQAGASVWVGLVAAVVPVLLTPVVLPASPGGHPARARSCAAVRFPTTFTVPFGL